MCGILSSPQSQIPQIFLAQHFSWTIPIHLNFPEIQEAREYKKKVDSKHTIYTFLSRLKCFPLFSTGEELCLMLSCLIEMKTHFETMKRHTMSACILKLI